MSCRLGEFKLLETDGSHEVMFTRHHELSLFPTFRQPFHIKPALAGNGEE
jgi:hypothetical protein